MNQNTFTDPLLFWYENNKRDLPWRDKNNAYYTWVSEIMLQQTRVEAVKPYFIRFTERLPDIRSLAECPEEQLLKLWEGLGYYSRVRNLQKTAKILMERYDGRLPDEFEELLTLPGIGRYTAGAIASIAYGKCAPAVDGNVLRVMTRLTEDEREISGIGMKKDIERTVMSLMKPGYAGEFTQALMELGAVICVPNGTPDCANCPVKAECRAFANDSWRNYPVKPEKKKRRIEERTILLIQDSTGTLLLKRPEKGLLAGLYEFPNLEGTLDSNEAIRYVEDHGWIPIEIEELPHSKHIFSHIEWRMSAYRIRVREIKEGAGDGAVLADGRERPQRYAIPSAYGAYISYYREEQS